MLFNTLGATIFASFAISVAAFAQPNITLDTAYQIRYVSNLNLGDSVINITNSGARDAGLAVGTTAATTGAMCVNVYAFAPDEQMISCCSCPVTPNGLVSLSARRDLVNNTLTPGVPTAIVVKLYATVPVAGSCSGSALNPGEPTTGMLGWGTTVHAGAAAGSAAAITEIPFLPATLSTGELGIGELGRFTRPLRLLLTQTVAVSASALPAAWVVWARAVSRPGGGQSPMMASRSAAPTFRSSDL